MARSPSQSPNVTTAGRNLVVQTIEQMARRCQVRGRVVSIGAAAAAYDLLHLDYFTSLGDEAELIGINIDHTQLGRLGDFEVIYGDAHAMPFDDASVDAVLCNAMLEHDPKFWLTLAEIRRVVKPGGIALIGTPGYTSDPLVPLLHRWLPTRGTRRADLRQATMTYIVHNAPGDFYRFSEQSHREVLLEGFELMELATVMKPPRTISCGRRRQLNEPQ